MNWLRRAIRSWLMYDKVPPPIMAEAHERTSQPSMRFSVIKAVNGRVIEVGKFKHNPHGPDWTFDLYIVGENERLSAAIERIMVIKQLET